MTLSSCSWGFCLHTSLLGSVSWVGHELEQVAICSVRRSVCVPSPLLVLPAQISSASILPAAGHVFLLASPTYCHFKNSRMHPKMDISSPRLLINIKKVLYSQSLLLKKLRDAFFLSSWCKACSQTPGSSRALKSQELRDRRRTLKDGILSHPQGLSQLMCKSLPELGHLSVVYQLKSNILLGVNNLGELSSRLEVVIVASQKTKT